VTIKHRHTEHKLCMLLFQGQIAVKVIYHRNLIMSRAALSYLARRQFAAAKCHATPSWVKRFMKQINRLKSSLQRRGSVRVYKMADGADGQSKMYVLFCYFAWYDY